MQQQTSGKEDATLNTQSNVNETPNKDSSLVKVEPLTGSPFSMITDRTEQDPLTHTGEKYFIALGNQRITEKYDTQEEALDVMVTEAWNITIILIIDVLKKWEEMKNKDKSVVQQAVERYQKEHPEVKVIPVGYGGL